MRKIIQAALLATIAIMSGNGLHAATCDQNSSQARPIDLGVSGGSIKLSDTTNGVVTGCCEGTLGALVKGPNGKYILSNNHVLARVNLAKPGEGIVQPGLIADSCPQSPPTSDIVAHLSAAAKINFAAKGKNTIDAAIAHIVAGDVSGDILNIGPISGKTVSPASALNLAVQKMGRTTCLTTGTVTGINGDLTVDYTGECNSGSGTANFVNQIIVTGTGGAFAAAGDSGSLVVTTDACPRAVGLLFASGSGANQIVLNPIGKVLGHFGVSMVAGCKASPNAADPAQVSGGEPSTEAFGGVSAEAVNAVTAIRSRHEQDLFALPGVVGTAIGAPDESGVPRIQVYVAEDNPALRATLPAELEGAQVEVIVSGRITAW